MGLLTLDIGRIVRVRIGDEVWPAMVVRVVKAPTTVDLLVSTDCGAEPMKNVERGDGDGCWHWPPQWVKHVAAEATAKARRHAAQANGVPPPKGPSGPAPVPP